MEFVDPNQNMGSFDDNFMDAFLDATFIDHLTSPNFSFIHSSSVELDFSHACNMQQGQESQKECSNASKQSYSFDIDFSQVGSACDDLLEFENQHLKKRGRPDPSSKPKSKACRERERRERLNESFVGLSCILEPGRAVKSDKLVVLNEAIRVVGQLRTENEDYKKENRKLLEEIESLKAEKNELREEKLKLKEERVKMEQEFSQVAMGAMGAPPYAAAAAYHGEANKMAGVFPSYGMYPMWHYLPPSIRDTSRDHVLRPPAA